MDLDADETRVLRLAIEKTVQLFRKRTHASDWSRNIEQGSESLQTQQQWARYYSWLACPLYFDIHKSVTEYMDCLEYNPPPYEDGMEVEETQNGPDLFIRVRNTRLTEDDEKMKC